MKRLIRYILLITSIQWGYSMNAQEISTQDSIDIINLCLEYPEVLEYFEDTITVKSELIEPVILANNALLNGLVKNDTLSHAKVITKLEAITQFVEKYIRFTQLNVQAKNADIRMQFEGNQVSLNLNFVRNEGGWKLLTKKTQLLPTDLN